MASSIIGSSFIIEGEISSEEDLVIQGRVKGKIHVKDDLYIENTGIVEADVDSRSVTVGGQLTGNITANERFELRQDARMVGDIRCPRIQISDGATFKGNIDMDA